MNLANAVTFVQQHGTPVEQARLAYLLHEKPVDSTTAAQLFTGQRQDGGWSPFWASAYSSLDATCYRLAQAEALGLVPAAPQTQRARDFLLARQRADGSWAETPPPEVALPSWLQPHTLETICYLTANCGFWLTQFSHSQTAVTQAAQFLHNVREEYDGLPGALHATWLAIAVWQYSGASKAVQQAQFSLAQHLPKLSASNLAWALTTFSLVGISLHTTLVQMMQEQLRKQQRSDGGWPNDDGSAGEVHTTLEAIRILKQQE